MVHQAAEHLKEQERLELEKALDTHRHLFATSKGDFGLTNIVQHQFNAGDQPAIKQRVQWYPVAFREEEQKLVEDNLTIGIIQESNSTLSSPTVEKEGREHVILH